MSSIGLLCANEFEWNEDKSEACFVGRGFDFAYACRVFLDEQRIVREDMRRDYGEPRYQAIGKIDGRLFVVVYTPRLSIFRIISARKANLREVNDFEANQS